MKISCNTQSLNKALQTVQKAIATKPSTPILAGIHMQTLENKVVIQANDLNMAIASTIDADIIEAGEIVVSGRMLIELARKLPGEVVSISKNKDNNSISIESGNSKNSLLAMNEDDYPQFPTFEEEKSIDIPDDKLKELIKKTIFACSNDEARPLFTGILVDIKEGNVTFVGTNTHRLAIKTLPLDTEENMSIIIPSKVLAEIARNLNSEAPSLVNIATVNNQVRVTTENALIVSRLIEGKFPDYKRVIPPKFSIKTNVNASELAGAVERVSLFSTEGEYSIVKVYVVADKLTINSSSPELGTGHEEIFCTTEGGEVNVAFNSRYVLDILKNIDAENVTLSMNTSLSPVCITAGEEQDYTYIVTPVRVVF
ncbi:MAG: DNA polymerase III subunit beta [Phascolarctobacterium sp.]|nr:DNA polymerase III subunit beta [Phascolarctobacterium sp.]